MATADVAPDDGRVLRVAALGIRDLTGREGTGILVLVAVAADGGAADGRMVDVLRRGSEDLVGDELPARVYHAVRDQGQDRAAGLLDAVRRSVAGAAARVIGAWSADLHRNGYEEIRVAVPIDRLHPGTRDLSLAEVLASHAHIHVAEHELYRESLSDAAEANDLTVIRYDPKTVEADASRALGLPADVISTHLAVHGQRLGRPWRREHREAATAAWMAQVGDERSESSLGT